MMLTDTFFSPSSDFTRFQSEDAEQSRVFAMKNYSLIFSRSQIISRVSLHVFTSVLNLATMGRFNKQYPKVSTCLRRARSASSLSSFVFEFSILVADFSRLAPDAILSTRFRYLEVLRFKNHCGNLQREIYIDAKGLIPRPEKESEREKERKRGKRGRERG